MNFSLLVERQTPQRSMGSNRIVVFQPELDDLAYLVEQIEQLAIYHVFTKSPVESLDVRILGGLTVRCRLD